MGRHCYGIAPCQLSGVGVHALPDQRGQCTLSVAVVEAEEKEGVGTNSEEVYLIDDK